MGGVICFPLPSTGRGSSAVPVKSANELASSTLWIIEVTCEKDRETWNVLPCNEQIELCQRFTFSIMLQATYAR